MKRQLLFTFAVILALILGNVYQSKRTRRGSSPCCYHSERRRSAAPAAGVSVNSTQLGPTHRLPVVTSTPISPMVCRWAFIRH